MALHRTSSNVRAQVSARRVRDTIVSSLEAAGALLVFAGVLYAVFGPVLSEELNWGGTLVMAWFVAPGVAMLAVAAVIALRGASGTTTYVVNALAVLLTASALFLLVTVGWLMLPGALFAALAAVATAWR